MRPTPTHDRGGLWHEVSNLLLGSLVLLLNSLLCGGLGALIVLRLWLLDRYGAKAPTFGWLVRLVFWHLVRR